MTICKKAKQILKQKEKEYEEHYDRHQYWRKGICPHCGNKEVIRSRPWFSCISTYKCLMCLKQDTYDETPPDIID